MEVIKKISSIIGMISGVIGLIVLIFKPVRSWFINLIMRTTKGASDGIKTDVESIKKDVGELKDMIADVGSMTSDNKSQLILVSVGVKDVLRNSILELCKRCLDRGYIEPLEKMRLMDMYEGYSGLGGNSYCKNEYEATLSLPERQDN